MITQYEIHDIVNSGQSDPPNTGLTVITQWQMIIIIKVCHKQGRFLGVSMIIAELSSSNKDLFSRRN